MSGDMRQFQARLARITAERAKRKKQQRYYWARWEEFYLPADLKPVSASAAIAVATQLAEMRFDWKRRGK